MLARCGVAIDNFFPFYLCRPLHPCGQALWARDWGPAMLPPRRRRYEQTVRSGERETFDAGKVLEGCVAGYSAAYPAHLQQHGAAAAGADEGAIV